MRSFHNQLEINTFDPRYTEDFARLNLEWIEKYFKVEETDKKALFDPVDYIINKGGEIFFAVSEGHVVGTVAMVHVDEGIVELSKMAVSPNNRGQGIANVLMSKCIEYGVGRGYEQIILYSNRKLAPAINLYEKFGFEEVELESDSYYDRSDIKMRLKLKH